MLYFIFPAFNSTTVALVPKCKNPSSMKEFRPISCCSMIYKCITKILANRLQKYLHDIIGKNQSAFTTGMSISVNILMAQELVKRYGRSTLSLNWNFVIDVLTCLKIPSMFISLIRNCLTTFMFSISFNGGLVGYFKGERGVWQGDLQSPYIFVIAMDVLSKLLDVTVVHGVYGYQPKCKKIKLIHLCFADDLMKFIKGNLDSIMGV